MVSKNGIILVTFAWGDGNRGVAGGVIKRLTAQTCPILRPRSFCGPHTNPRLKAAFCDGHHTRWSPAAKDWAGVVQLSRERTRLAMSVSVTVSSDQMH